MAGIRRSHDERGNTYKSDVVAELRCAYCDNAIVQRREGRPVKYCSPGCRTGAHRKSRPSRLTRQGRSDGQVS
jgi:hypothetical protein